MEEPQEVVPGEEGEGEEEAPFEFPVVEDPDPYNMRSYLSKGGKVINERLSEVERAIKNGEMIDGMYGNECGDGDTSRKYAMDYINAKSLLLKASSTTGENMYDHLTRIVSRCLETQPPDSVDIVEDLSRQLKYERFSGRYLEKHVQDLKIDDEDPNLDVRDPSKTVELAYLQQPLLLGGLGEDGGDELDPELEILPMPNFLELAFYMHQASTGFSTDELFRIGLSVKKLIGTEPLQKVRLWGKIFGTEKNYIVIEGDWQEGEGDLEEEPEDVEEPDDYLGAEFDDAAAMGEGGEDAEDDVPLPVSKWKPPVIIPKEINEGVNKCAYYVTTEIGAPWVRLPMVTPEQIACSRKIKKAFTGDLEKPIVTYPPFPGPNQAKKSVPGLEKHYLRCQIVRISAGTHVSPAGYFNFGGEEDEAEDAGAGGSPMENINFQGIPVIELVDPAMENWVHHVPYVLPQGRTTWFDPNPAGEEEGGEGGDDLGLGLYGVPAEPEIGPPLLSTIAEDEPFNDDVAWTATLSSNTIPQYGVAIVRNNRWPGAVTLSTGKKFFNIYVGDGLKYIKGEFQPELPPTPMTEYVVGPEITETVDPTPEEEEALRRLLMKGQGEGEGGEGGEGEEEDEDED